MRMEIHGSCSRHRGSRLASPSARVGETSQWGEFFQRSLLFKERVGRLYPVISFVRHTDTTVYANSFAFPFIFVASLNLILDPEESDRAAVGSRRMLFPNCGGIPSSQDMPSSRNSSDVSDLGLGLHSLSLSSWDRPWSSQDSDTHTPLSQVQSSSSGKYQRFSVCVWAEVVVVCFDCSSLVILMTDFIRPGRLWFNYFMWNPDVVRYR